METGEIFGIRVHNGAGKTTTIRIFITRTKLSSGSVHIKGFDVNREPSKAKAELGIVQQHISITRDLSVKENLELHGRLHRLPAQERKKRIDELLEYVDLTEHADQLIDQLSGGMKRRAMIARALLHRYRLLFLDEPRVGLDASARRRVWDLIRRMNGEGGTVSLTTHYIEEAEALCNRVGIIHTGRLIALVHAPVASQAAGPGNNGGGRKWQRELNTDSSRTGRRSGFRDQPYRRKTDR